MDFFSGMNLWGTSRDEAAEQTPAAAPSPFASLTASIAPLAESASATFGEWGKTLSGWFGGGDEKEVVKGTPPAGVSMSTPWERLSRGIGDLGRGLGEEGPGALLDLGGVLDRQQAQRQRLEEDPLGPSDHARNDGKTPATDPSAMPGWRKMKEGWLPAGEAAPVAKASFGLTDSKYLRENDTYFQGGAERTKYDDAAGRDGHRLGASDGLVLGPDGRALDTSSAGASLTPGGGKGHHIFAADGSGVYAADAIGENEASRKNPGPRGREATHHSTFAAGANVHAAGELTARDGWLKMISNNSGHYKPDARGNVQAVEALDAMGVNTDAALVHAIAYDEETDVQSHDYFNARAFAASRGNEELLTAHKSMFGEIHDAAGSLRAGTLDGKLHRDNVQAARGAGKELAPKTAVADERPPTEAALRAAALRAEAHALRAGGADGDKVDTRAVAATSQTETGQIRFDNEVASPTDVRGTELGGWSPGGYNDAHRRLKVFEDKAREADLAQELAEEAAPAPTAAPATMSYLQTETPAAPATMSYLQADTPAAPATMQYGQMAEPEEQVETKEEKRARKEAMKAAKAAAKADKRAAKLKAAEDARQNGAHLGRHDEPVGLSRAGKLAGGWRKQSRALVESPADLVQQAAWRPDAGEETKAPEPVKSFPIDPRNTNHYVGEFHSYFASDPGLDPAIAQRTKRYSPEELEQHELRATEGGEVDRHGKRHAQSGLLTRASGEVMDTTEAGTTNLKDADAGRNIFALDGFDVHSAAGKGRRQKLYASDVGAEKQASRAAALENHARGEKAVHEHVHHSSFNGGGALDGAGDMAVKQGFVQNISNHSGHYEPDWKSNLNAVRALDAMGVNLDATRVENKHRDMSNDLVTETYQARALLASQGNLPLLDRQKNLFEAVRARPQSASEPDLSPDQLAPSMPGKWSKGFAAPAGSFDAWQGAASARLDEGDVARAQAQVKAPDLGADMAAMYGAD